MLAVNRIERRAPHALLRRTRALGASVALLAGTIVAIEAPVAAPAVASPRANLATVYQDMYAGLKQGIALTCDPQQIYNAAQGVKGPEPTCTMKVQVSLSTASARYLGLKSTVLTSGTMKGPTQATSTLFPDQKGSNVYTLPFPTALVNAIKAKKVVAIALTITGTAAYDTASGRQTEAIQFARSKEDIFGQGKRFGCWPLGQGPLAGGGDLIGGYLSYGQSCPPFPGKAG